MSEFAAVPADVLASLDASMEAEGFTGLPASNVAAPPDGFDPGNVGLPQGETEAPSVATPEAQEGQVAPDQSAPQEDSFTDRFDPNALPPELLPAYKLMQADYTNKRQRDAEALRLVQQFGDPQELQAAAELYQRMQDPQSVLEFVQQASNWLASEGYAEYEDVNTAPAAPTVGQDNLSQALDSLAAGDPELAPLAEAVKQMQAQLQEVQQQTNARLEAEREETQTLQVLGEIQRQENVIRTEFPQYGEEDIDAIYELAAYYDGDLLQAQQSYEAAFARRLGSYMAAKEATPAPIAPAGTPGGASMPELQYDPLNLKEAHAAAMDVVRLIESQ